ncbi:MAG: hypothetical protein GX444_05105 [Myxococcales bacterium]|nr:hypothetical protein [Myxococcales bacterium]
MIDRRFLLLLILLALAGGCATKATDYYPLAVGNAWTYDIAEEGGGRRQTTEIVYRRQYNKYYFNNGEILLIAGDRSLVNAKGVTVLENILRPGYQWFDNEMEFRVAAVDRPLDVPAGRFNRTVEVTWTSKFPGDRPIDSKTPPTLNPGPNPRIFIYRTTYARGIGKVREELTTIQPDGTRTLEFVAVLTGYRIRDGKAFRTGGLPPPSK